MNPERPLNPFIIYWDLNSSTYNNEIALRICDELVEAGIFVLNLRDLFSPINKGTIDILKRLSNKQIRINLTANKTVLESSLELIHETGITKLYIDFDSLERSQSALNEIKKGINQGHPIGLSMRLNENNLKEIPGFLALCIKNQIKDITIPIQRAVPTEIFIPDSDNLTWLSDELKDIEIERLDLSIHDPFLWKLFNKKENPNEEGCNGARTMMFVSEELEVTPCPIFPVSIGNLRDLSLKEIVSSEKRLEVLEKLSYPPKECGDCKISAKCRGGCRGRTYCFSEGFDKKDPACYLPGD